MNERPASSAVGREQAVWRRLLPRVLLKLLEIVLCLVHIFQANLVCLMAHPKLAFYVARSVYLISPSTFPPQKFVAERTLTWDLRTRSVPSLLLISLVVPAGYFLEITHFLSFCWASTMRADHNFLPLASTWPFHFSDCTPVRNF